MINISFKKAHYSKVLCLFVCLSLSQFIFAQGNNDIPHLTDDVNIDGILDTLPDDATIGLEPVTITFRSLEDIRSPQNIKLISPEIKSQFGRVLLQQILNTTTGVVMHSGALNTNRITIRGIGSRNLFGTAKIKAYLNDIPLTNGVGETSLEDIDLSLIEDIKVVKGPTSSLYGAGLGGMIQMNTRSKSTQPSMLTSELGVGAYGLVTAAVGGNFKLNKQHRLIATINNTESDGYRSNNNYKRKGFALIGDHALSSKIKISWIANYIDLLAQIPSSLNLTDYSDAPHKAAFTWQSVNGFEDYTKFIGGLSAAVQTSDKSVLKISLFTNSFDSYEVRPFNVLSESNSAIGLRSTFLQSLSNKIDLNLGIETFTESYKWKTFETVNADAGAMISDNEEDRKYTNLFFNLDVSLSDNIYIKGGINLNTTNYDYLDLFEDMTDLSGKYKFDSVLSPYLNINVDLAPESTQSSLIVYGLLSHGFSPPTLEETLQPDGQINPEIQPEKGLNIEVGLSGRHEDKFQYSLSLNSMLVKDLLVARRTAADQFIGINAGKTLHNGLETSLAYKWKWGKQAFKISTDLAINDYTFKEFEDGDDDYSGNPLTGTPKHVWRSQLEVKLTDNLEIGLGHYSLGDQSLRDDNSASFAGYTLAHAYLKVQDDLSDRFRVETLFRAENIFNQEHASMLLINAGSFGGNAPRYYYPGLPSNQYVSVKVIYRLSE